MTIDPQKWANEMKSVCVGWLNYGILYIITCPTPPCVALSFHTFCFSIKLMKKKKFIIFKTNVQLTSNNNRPPNISSKQKNASEQRRWRHWQRNGEKKYIILEIFLDLLEKWLKIVKINCTKWIHAVFRETFEMAHHTQTHTPCVKR